MGLGRVDVTEVYTTQMFLPVVYAHPSFPLILKLGGDITLRSNWEGYLKEFALSVESADELYRDEGTENFARPYLEDAQKGPQERVDKSIAFTNFEKEFDDVGEKTYELVLRMKDMNKLINLSNIYFETLAKDPL